MYSNLVILVALVLVTNTLAQTSYTKKYDNIDLDEILNNDRLYRKYFDCLTNKAKCTPDGTELKKVLPEVMSTACSKCSQRQKQGAEKLLKFMLNRKPRDYDAIERLYDPNGSLKKKYLAESKKQG